MANEVVLARAVVQLGADTNDFVQGLKGAVRVITDLDGAVRQLGQRLTLGLTIPIAGIGLGAIKLAADFESSFAGIRKTMDLTEVEFDQLAQANRDLAKEIPVSVNELNRIGELAGQLGISGVENITAFEDTIAKLAATTDLTADQAAVSFAQIANIIQLPQDQIGRLGSAVVGLGNKFAATESGIAEFTQRIAGAGALVKLTVGDITGIGTAFASLGIEAEAGGTAIQTVFLEMLKAVNTGGEALRGFARAAGVSTEEFARLFKEDAAGAFTLFVEGLAAEGDNAIKVLDDLGLADVRLTRALLSAAGAGDLLSRAIAQGNKDFSENIALNEEARKRFSTFASQLSVFINKVKDLGIAFGNIILPPLTLAVRALGAAVEFAGKVFDFLPGPIKAAIVVFGAFLALLGPLIFALGAFFAVVGSVGKVVLLVAVGQRLGLTFASISAFVARLVPGFTALARVVAPVAGRLGLVAAAGLRFIPVIGQIITVLSIVALVWRKWGDDLKLIGEAVFNVVTKKLEGFGESISKVFDALVGTVKKFGGLFLPELKRIFIDDPLKFINGFIDILAIVPAAFQQALRFVSPALAEAASAFGRFVVEVRAEMDRLRTNTAAAVESTNAELKKTGRDIPPPTIDLEKVREVLKQLETDLRVIGDSSRLLGEAFDATSAKSGVYSTALQGLLALGLRPTNVEVQKISSQLLALAEQVKTEERLKAIQAVFTALSEDTAKAAISLGLFGGEVSLTQIKLNLTRVALQKLIDEGVNPADEKFKVLHATFQQLAADVAFEERLGVVAIGISEVNKNTDVLVSKATKIRDFGIVNRTAALESAKAFLVAQQAIEGFTRIGVRAIDRLGDTIAEFVLTGKFQFKEFVNSLIGDIARLIAKLLVLKAVSVSIPGFGGFLGNLFGGFFQRGGTLKRGEFGIAGEAGPELVFAGNTALQIQPMHEGGDRRGAGDIAAAILEEVGPPPQFMSPEMMALDSYWRRLFGAMVDDGKRRGVLR